MNVFLSNKEDDPVVNITTKEDTWELYVRSNASSFSWGDFEDTNGASPNRDNRLWYLWLGRGKNLMTRSFMFPK